MTQASDPARNARILDLWQAKNSFSMIGRILCISRLAVAGVVYRAVKRGQALRRGTCFKVGNELRRGGPRRNAEAIAKELRVQLRPVVDEPPAGMPIRVMLTPSGREFAWHDRGGCCFIANDDMLHPAWCNAPVMADRDYCWFHYRRMHVR